MGEAVFLIELVLFATLALGWAIWEYRKTSRLHQQTLEAERRAAQDPARDDDAG